MSRANLYLALCLLDAIEDENFEALSMLLSKHRANPNTIVLEKDVAPMHLVIGAEDVAFAERATSLMLQHGGDANLPTTDQMLTPLHVAANLGRVSIVRLLLKARGNVELLDDEGRTPIQHAIDEGHFDVVRIIQNHVFEEKIERKREKLLFEQQRMNPQQPQAILSPDMRNMLNRRGLHPSARFHGNNNLSALQVLEERKLTPNKIHYNFDVTSPYYVNITHRRRERLKPLDENFNQKLSTEEELPSNKENTMPPETTIQIDSIVEKEQTNLFELTESNLKHFTRDSQSTGRRSSFIECWREKIAEMRNRSQVSRRLDDIDRILNSFSENLAIRSFMDEVEETFVTAQGEENDDSAKGLSVPNTQQEVDVMHAEPAAVQSDQQTEPVDEPSLENETVIIQISEEYIHTDDEAGIVFREKKMTTAKVKETISNSKIGGPSSVTGRNPSLTSLSTVITLPPLDYDTDALRAELTTFGEPPGPITKSTKKLYLRKLVKFRRHPERLASATDARDNNQPNFSVELMATIRKEDVFGKILDHQSLEVEMASEFQSAANKPTRQFREGHLKKSFIYLLLDPRLSANLPAQQNHLEAHELWQRFLSSVFYVGKGKSSRPYCHLYDAMKLYHQKESSASADDQATTVDGGGDMLVEVEQIILQCNEVSITPTNNIRKYCRTTEMAQRKQQIGTDSAKLNRIIDIWNAGKGVVCLHVFHNIMPAEAYTREAAIIDAFGVPNLTNLKRGDYYAKCLSWPMKKRKQLGILLLYKAMLMFLAEGETQLLPSDLI